MSYRTKWLISKRIRKILKSKYKAKPVSKVLRDSLKRDIEQESLEDKLSYQKQLDKTNAARRNYSHLRSEYKLLGDDDNPNQEIGNIFVEGCVIFLIVFGAIIALYIASC